MSSVVQVHTDTKKTSSHSFRITTNFTCNTMSFLLATRYTFISLAWFWLVINALYLLSVLLKATLNVELSRRFNQGDKIDVLLTIAGSLQVIILIVGLIGAHQDSRQLLIVFAIAQPTIFVYDFIRAISSQSERVFFVFATIEFILFLLAVIFLQWKLNST